jgi:hypothetical protein
VAKERRISVEDPDMRQSSSQKINGYKRHVLKDLDIGVIRAVALTKANTPESSATVDISRDLKFPHTQLSELHIDRAYLSSHRVTERSENLKIFCNCSTRGKKGAINRESLLNRLISS